MSDSAKRGEWEKIFADKVPARFVLTTTALVLGGPAAAVAATTLTPIVEHLLNKGNQRFVGNAASVIGDAGTLAGIEGPIALQAHVEADDRRLALTIDALRAASDTLDQRKLQTLARVLGFGFSDDARLDMAAVYMRAIRDLEPYHVRVLAGFRDFADGPGATQEGIMSEEDIHAVHEKLGVGVFAIIATLEREGLVAGMISSPGASVSVGGFVITTFGRQVLAWTEDHASPA